MTDAQILLKEAQQRVKQLEEENRRLQAQLKKFKTLTKQQRARLKSKSGALRSARAKVQKLRKINVKLRRAAAKPTKRISSGGSAIKSVTHRTRAQYLEQIKPQFIDRFLQRLAGAYADWDQAWNNDIRRILMSWSWEEIDGTLQMINLDKMYYESTSYSINHSATGKMIYDYFIQYLPQ